MFRSLIFSAIAAAVIFSSCSTTSKVILPKDVDIVSRKEWGAAAPVLTMKQHIPTRITVHHTATMQNSQRNLTQKLEALQKFSQERSTLGDGRIKEQWADIPYHFYIAVDGSIGEGRQLKYVGDSNTPYDPTGHALIVLEGNFEKEKVTPQQFQSLKALTLSIARRYGIAGDKISGHKDNASTACPGADLYALLPELRKVVDGQ